jgi:P-type Cu+ transporter
MATDPVCGMYVDEKASEATEQYASHYASETFYFCSQDCQDQFEEAPEQYARKSA